MAKFHSEKEDDSPAMLVIVLKIMHRNYTENDVLRIAFGLDQRHRIHHNVRHVAAVGAHEEVLDQSDQWASCGPTRCKTKCKCDAPKPTMSKLAKGESDMHSA